MKNCDDQFETTAVVASDHASIAGHFPGNPVVPGVVVIEFVWQAATKFLKNAALKEVVQVKFNAVLRPDRKFIIQLELSESSLLKFWCIDDNRHFATGLLRIVNR